ncbi:SDR family oxidoreductase [Pectobacterium aroidearum]|uniref:SDR family oxidoreductase n=1 Tax=Pectobacterium aroidearum TaxID=1201031 RepID=A0AAW3SUC8_9GAMM|nr:MULTISPECIES: SDR family NAD(P)-dependent oxidoreductase [Pectobacterium]MBA5198795.1 SDR family oxidoreductase [Pectobacterium aroidearum]MBA5203158.1 SDR family oxidoreductase [Pectobacterium aroidearum]MBA5226702.1 SDR family oxidoreductase [Pectobacterium aroidearum]MBA5231587.1 SDR family oxidoreductase [Pectobacterium aroidearum]MBA5736732.1 SDR family oxidoreductase [Pectobacterium aroidearum]
MLLQGKNVLITGTRRGMGRAMVDAFAANGANIYAHARQEDSEWLAELRTVAAKHQVEIWPLCFDMTDYAAMKQAIKRLMTDKRPIDAVINNAGITLNALFQMTSEDILRKQFEVNFFSVFLFTQYIAKFMARQKHGSIINISSTAGEDGNPGKSAYGASKAAVIAMTKSIAAELGEIGIRANCIAPGITDTDMLDTLPVHILEETKNTADLRRAGLPSEIADTAVFLASELSSYITGQVIRVDGGLK